MDLGCFINPFYGDEEPGANAGALDRRVAVASELAYDYVEVADHHVTRGDQFFQNVPTAGRVSAQFDHVATLFLLPLYHPLFVAEYLGTLGAFVDTLDFWCANGGNEHAFDALGIPMSDRTSRFEEGLTLVERLLTEDRVTFDGEHYSVSDVSISPKADVRVCIGGLAKPAITRAARRGDAWVAHPTESIDDLDRKVSWFEAAGGDRVIARRDALVLEDADEATQRARSLLEGGYRNWPLDADWPIVGDATDVADELDRLAALGVDEVVVGAMDDERAEETITEFATGANHL